MLRILPSQDAQSFITRKAVRLAEAEQVVAPIFDAVRARGDEALFEYARQFDSLDGNSLPFRDRISTRRNREYLPSFLRASRRPPRTSASTRRCSFHARRWTDFPDGRRLGQIVRPLDSMGAYIPAGRYPLPSTLLMTVIPAQVAGVDDHLRRIAASQR